MQSFTVVMQAASVPGRSSVREMQQICHHKSSHALAAEAFRASYFVHGGLPAP